MSLPPWWISSQIIPGGEVETVGTHQETSFSGDQQKKFGIDAKGKVLDQARFDAALAKVKKVRQEVTIEHVSVDEFPTWRAGVTESEIAHIKGFGSGMGDFYNDDVLKLLKDCKLLVWDGDDYDTSGFTKIVPLFLKAQPDAKAVAFRLNYEVDDLKESWASVAKEFPGRLAVVPVELIAPDWKDAARFGVTEEMKSVQGLPGWAQEYFLLGRLACKVTGSKLMISLGGGGIASKEASVSTESGMTWHVFALSRGRKEQFPTLVDWAVNAKANLVKGKDPNEDDAFGPVEVKSWWRSVATCCSSRQ